MKRLRGLPDLKQNAGFTLTELMLSLVVFSVIGVGVSESYVLFQRYWTDGSREISYQSAGRTAVERMGIAIRRASDVTINDSANATVMDIEDVNGSTSTFTYNKTEKAIYYAGTFALGGSGTGIGSKVTICHVPGGNPNNAHTITISVNALNAHLAHGDTIGACGSPGNGNGNGNGNSNGNGNGNGNSNGNGNGAGIGSAPAVIANDQGVILANVEAVNGQPIFRFNGNRTVDIQFQLLDQDNTDGHQGRHFSYKAYWRN